MNSSPYTKQRHLFKAYDIRGARKFFSEPFVQALSQVFAEQYRANSAKTVVIGHDMRHGSFAIAQCLAETISQNAIEVIWLGLVTTPIMAFWAHEYEGHGIIATASHSEGHINGLKWLMAGESPSSIDIEQLYHQLILNTSNTRAVDTVLPVLNTQCKSQSNTLKSTSDLKLPSISSYKKLDKQYVANAYFIAIKSVLNVINRQLDSHFNQQSVSSFKTPPSRLSIVIDCLNGATGLFSHAFFSQFDDFVDQIHTINVTPDGSFPKGNPDPTESGRLNELQQAVLHHNADIGLSFDGDGDRLMVVDNLGEVVEPDHLLYLLARVAINDTTAADTSNFEPMSSPTVIFDVKCSHHLPVMIQNIGATPQMSKTGSSIMRKALQTGESNAIFAGELSGHFLFNDGYFILHDDAMYAGLRLINWLSQQDRSLSIIIEQLPSMVNTPDVYLPFNSDGKEINKDRSTLKDLADLCQWLQRYCVSNHNQPINDNKLDVDDFCTNKDYTITADICNDNSNDLGMLSFVRNMESSTKEFTLPKNTRLTCIDGIRLDFNDGFGVIRPSNTSQSLTVRFAGNTLADLRRIQQRFVQLFEPIDHDLAQLIAQINPSS